MLFTTILRYSMILQIALLTSMLIHLISSNDMDEESKCLDQFGPIYCNLLEQLNEIQQPMRMSLMQQLNQKRSLNKARNKLFKSSRFWGKRKDDTFNDDNPASTFDNTNLDESDRRSGHQKLGLTMSSRFWG